MTTVKKGKQIKTNNMFQTRNASMTNSSNATEVNKVYKTNDLLIFKVIGGNRVPNPQHIKRLKTSILQNGILCNPILVNEKMEVIDGQHREQIEDAYKEGRNSGQANWGYGNDTTSEQYFNETFKK